jgi:hypothetical protein
MNFLTVVLLLVTLSSAVEFKCIYKGDYTCEVVTGRIIDKLGRYVTQTTGDHLIGKANKDVGMFDARKVTIKYFPRNLHTHFPNLHQIFIERKLREITKEDLEPFPKLIYLYLSFNEIEIIEKDLFIYNPELKLVFLNENRIKYVDPNVFDNLSNLVYLGFDDNDCYSEIVENSRSGVRSLIENVKENCSKYLIPTELELKIMIVKKDLVLDNQK